ncbi:MAG: hypothetical protein VYB44_07055 [Bacteroidota bacterium]|nr:hypothetical protein [Bacteroidota bacterium]
MINILAYLVFFIRIIKKDWVDYTLSGTTLSSFYAFQEQISHDFYWIPITVGILTILKITLDIYTSVKNIKLKRKIKKHETQDT